MSYFLNDHSVERTLLLDGNACINQNDNDNRKPLQDNIFQSIYDTNRLQLNDLVDPGTQFFDFNLNEDVYIRKMGLKWASIPLNFECIDDETEIVLVLHSKGQILRVQDTSTLVIPNKTSITPLDTKAGFFLNHIILPSNETQSSEEMNFISTNLIVNALRALFTQHFSTNSYTVRDKGYFENFDFATKNTDAELTIGNFEQQNVEAIPGSKVINLLKRSISDMMAHYKLYSEIERHPRTEVVPWEFLNDLVLDYDPEFNQIMINLPTHFFYHPKYAKHCQINSALNTPIPIAQTPVIYLPQLFTITVHAIPKFKILLPPKQDVWSMFTQLMSTPSGFTAINNETLQNLAYLASATFGVSPKSFKLQNRVSSDEGLAFMIRFTNFNINNYKSFMNFHEIRVNNQSMFSYNNLNNDYLDEKNSFLPFGITGVTHVRTPQEHNLYKQMILTRLPQHSFMSAKICQFLAYQDHMIPDEFPNLSISKELNEAWIYKRIFVTGEELNEKMSYIEKIKWQQQAYTYNADLLAMPALVRGNLQSELISYFNITPPLSDSNFTNYFRGDVRSFPISFYPTSRGMNYIVLHCDLMQSSTVKPININVMVPSHFNEKLNNLSLTKDSTILAYIPFDSITQFGQRYLYNHNADKDYLIPCCPNQIRKVRFWFTTPSGKIIKFFCQYPTILLNIIDF